MKKTVITSCLILCQIIVFAKCDNSCLPDGITFETQAQIDSFQVNYPNCNTIRGDVMISGDDITNLNGLNVLTSIEGDLYISNNSNLTNH